jgi:2-methylcitrate dehydratase PrpD
VAVGAEMSAMAGYIADARTLELPDEVAWRAKQHFLDSVASVVSGSARPAGRAGSDWLDVAFPGSTGPCSLLGTARKASALGAAMANGMAAHADETDDSHASSLSHPGCSVAPAILAASEEVGATGAAVLQAYVVGYDIGTRIGRATQSAFRDRAIGKWSSHSVVGTLCAAAATGAIYGFDPDEARFLLSYATQLTSGVTTWVRDQSHVQKAFVFAGMPASHAILAASMVRTGCDGVDDPFSGAPNWLQAMSDSPDLAELSSELGSRFEVMQATIKKYAVGSPSQAAIEAVVQLLAEQQVAAADIEAITVALPSESAVVVDNRAMPNVNVQYLVAGTLIDGGFSMRMSQDHERLADPEVVALMAKVTLVPEAEFAHQRAARVEISLRGGGAALSRTVRDVRGTPKNPMSFEESRTKAEDLIGEVTGAARASAACDLVSHLEDVSDITELIALLVEA